MATREVAATLLAKVGFRREIDRLRDATAIVFVGALLSMSISASVGTGVLVASGALPADALPGSWAVWWAGDAMGVLVVTPLVLSLVLPWRRPGTPRWKHLEAAVLFALTATVSVGAIGADLHLMFLVIPLLGWAAWRFQQRGAAPAALLVVVVASWAAATGVGPFRTGTMLEKMLTLQAFNATVAFCSFFAAVVTERMHAHQALERAAARLEARVRQRTSQLSATNLQLRKEITLCLVRVHGEIDLSNAHEVSSAIGIFGAPAGGGSQRHHLPRQRRGGAPAPAGGAAAVSATAAAPRGAARISRSQGARLHGPAEGHPPGGSTGRRAGPTRPRAARRSPLTGGRVWLAGSGRCCLGGRHR
jgi:MASE1